MKALKPFATGSPTLAIEPNARQKTTSSQADGTKGD